MIFRKSIQACRWIFQLFAAIFLPNKGKSWKTVLVRTSIKFNPDSAGDLYFSRNKNIGLGALLSLLTKYNTKVTEPQKPLEIFNTPRL